MVSIFIAGRLKLVCVWICFWNALKFLRCKSTSIKEREDIFYPSIRLIKNNLQGSPENEENSVEKKSPKNEFLHVISSSTTKLPQ
jgi:hypothetical protein